MRAVLYFFTFALVSISAEEVNLADLLVPCEPKDVLCNTRSGQAAIKPFILGLENIGVPSLDPLTQQKPFKTNLISMHDGYITGLKDSVVSNARWFFEDKYVALTLTTNLYGKSKYVLNQVIGGTPVKGFGEMELSFEKIQISLVFPFKIVSKDGSDFVKILGNENVIDILGKTEYKFTSFVDENNKPNLEILAHLNDNIAAFSKVFSTGVESIKVRISDALTRSFSSAFDALPLKVFIKDYENTIQ